MPLDNRTHYAYIRCKENSMEHVIYKLTSPSGKIYIGRTNDFYDRMKDHKSKAKKGIDFPIYRAVRKYGWDNFIKEIIAAAPTEPDAIILEGLLIKKYDTVRKGYNATYVTTGGGDVLLGQPEKRKKKKEKLSEMFSGEKNPMYGKSHTKEAKAKQKVKAKGRFSLPWFIERNGEKEGTRLYEERCQRLRDRDLKKDDQGKFV